MQVNWVALVADILVILILVGFLVLLFRIDQTGRKRTDHVVKMEEMLTRVVQSNANAAQTAAESARTLADSVHNLVALLALKEPPETHE